MGSKIHRFISCSTVGLSCPSVCGTLGPAWRLRGKESVCSTGHAGDMSSIPGSGRSPGGGRGDGFQSTHQPYHIHNRAQGISEFLPDENDMNLK